MNCSFVYNHGLWRANADIDGERFIAFGKTPMEAAMNLELLVLGYEPVYFVHMDIDLNT